MSEIIFKVNASLDVDQVQKLYLDTTLSDRRPIKDKDRLKGMVENANLTVSAWIGDTLVGLCRSLSDFSYVTYIADLAVAQEYQKQGIGKSLIEKTKDVSGEGVKLVLLSAPSANAYYSHIGFDSHPRAWILEK